MHQLLTTTESDKHSHIVYLDATTGQGVVTEAGAKDRLHAHELIATPRVDEATGEQNGWDYELAVAPDGHTHQLKKYEPKIKRPEKDDDEVVRDVISLFRTSTELEQESVKLGREAEDFYCGKQWDDRTRQNLEKFDRACLTINVTQRHVDELCGHQRQLRTDLRYLPVGEGDQRVVDILNVLSKNALEQCYFEREESKAFEDQVIPGRGNFNLFVDFQEDIQGTAKVEQFPWDGVSYGAHEKEDLADCEYLTKHRMYSLGKLKSIWEKKFDDIQGSFTDYIEVTHTAESKDPDKYAGDGLEKYRTPQTINGLSMVDIARKEFRVLEQWRKLYLPSAVAMDNATEEVFSLFGWKQKDINAVKEIPGLSVIEKTITKMRITRVCGNVLLKDEYPADIPADDFFVVPVYAHKKGGRFWGKVEILKDPQREINKRTSQSIDIGNKMASYGWFIDPNTFPEPKDREKFINNSSAPGFVADVNDVDRPPKQVTGAPFPAEIVNLQKMSLELHSSLANVIVSPDEGGSPGEILQRQRMKLVGNEYLFDNLSFAKKKIGRLLIAIFQRYYTPERIYRIVSAANNKAMRQPVANGQQPGLMIGGTPFEEISKEDIINLLQTEDLAKYDVVVSESTWSPSERIAVMLMVKEMGAGPEVVIPLADIPEEQKSQLLAGLANSQATKDAGEAKKGETEIQKTLIAAGYVPPKVAQEQGLAMDPNGQPVSALPPAVQNDQTAGLAG